MAANKLGAAVNTEGIAGGCYWLPHPYRGYRVVAQLVLDRLITLPTVSHSYAPAIIPV